MTTLADLPLPDELHDAITRAFASYGLGRGAPVARLPSSLKPVIASAVAACGVDPNTVELGDTPAGRIYARIRDERTARLRDGSTGWYTRLGRADDCGAAAIATALQVPIEDVPDPRIDERLAAGDSAQLIDHEAQHELSRWLHARGLRMLTHGSVPVDRPRWVGVVPHDGAFQSHCLILNGADVLFDPAWHPALSELKASQQALRVGLDDVRWGISFEPVEPRGK